MSILHMHLAEQITFRCHFKIQIGSTDLFIKIRTIHSSNTVQGRNWRVGRVGHCPPSFWQFSSVVARRITTCPPSFRRLLTPLYTIEFGTIFYESVFKSTMLLGCWFKNDWVLSRCFFSTLGIMMTWDLSNYNLNHSCDRHRVELEFLVAHSKKIPLLFSWCSIFMCVTKQIHTYHSKRQTVRSWPYTGCPTD